jgi:PAS domain S-box-containing protein
MANYRMRGKSKTALRALTIAYVVALLALAALAIVSYFIPQREYRTQQTSDAVLRAASRQEVLLEQVSFLAYRMAIAREASERQQCRVMLSNAVNEMEAIQHALLEGDPASRLPGNPPPSVRAIYFGPPFFLDRQMKQYFADARTIINAPDAELNRNNPHLAAIRDAVEGELPATLDAVARRYQQRDEAGVLFLQQQEIGTLATSLLVLLLMGLFLFRPMVRRIGREQEALRESGRRLATLLNNLPGAAYRLPRDHDEPMAYVSEGIVKLTEYEPDYFVGPAAKSFASLIVPADSPAAKKAIQQAVSCDRPYVVEYRIRTRTGKEKWLWEKGVCVRDDEGKQVALEGFIEDISQWKRAEEARVQAERLAAVGSMAAKLAHEIRNPLGTIKLNLDLLGDEVGSLGPGSSANTDEAQTLLQAINLEVRRIQRVADDYLQFGHMPKAHRLPVILNDLVSRELSFLSPLLNTSHIQMRTEFERSLPPVQADADQLWQAILNLIRNALEAMPKGGTLELRTASTTDEVVLHLTDTGKGMSEEERLQIFRPFFTTKPVGTGLGLTLTQQIIGEHGGRIECASVVGQGTTFSLSLPLRAETFPGHEG